MPDYFLLREKGKKRFQSRDPAAVAAVGNGLPAAIFKEGVDKRNVDTV